MTTVAKKLYSTMRGPPRLSFSVLKPALLSSLFQRVVPRRLTVTFHKVFVRFDVLAFELRVQVRKGCFQHQVNASQYWTSARAAETAIIRIRKRCQGAEGPKTHFRRPLLLPI
jgi:hypothetical protein